MERFYGSPEDQRYIASYLNAIRALDPIEISTIEHPISIAEILRAGGAVNAALFQDIVSDFVVYFYEKFGLPVCPIPYERYYTGYSGMDKIGGFHSKKSLGYQYWLHAGFVETLNPETVSTDLLTVELARSYLHDCLHHSSFRSFRRIIKTPAPTRKEAKHRLPEVYREQYGFNFRNAHGVSYSSPDLTRRSPEAINLNLLMDGVVVFIVGRWLKSKWLSSVPENSALEAEIKKEIALNDFSPSSWPSAHGFSTAVTLPSVKFINHWGGESFVILATRAMVTGDLIEARAFFDQRTGIENAWEKLFKQATF